MKKYSILAFIIVSCGSQIQILPPNEDQYAICQKAIDCSILSDDKIRKCVACIDKVVEETTYTVKQIKASIVNAECDVVKAYSETSSVRQCITGK